MLFAPLVDKITYIAIISNYSELIKVHFQWEPAGTPRRAGERAVGDRTQMYLLVGNVPTCVVFNFLIGLYLQFRWETARTTMSSDGAAVGSDSVGQAASWWWWLWSFMDGILCGADKKTTTQ